LRRQRNACPGRGSLEGFDGRILDDRKKSLEVDHLLLGRSQARTCDADAALDPACALEAHLGVFSRVQGRVEADGSPCRGIHAFVPKVDAGFATGNEGEVTEKEVPLGAERGNLGGPREVCADGLNATFRLAIVGPGQLANVLAKTLLALVGSLIDEARASEGKLCESPWSGRTATFAWAEYPRFRAKSLLRRTLVCGSDDAPRGILEEEIRVLGVEVRDERNALAFPSEAGAKAKRQSVSFPKPFKRVEPGTGQRDAEPSREADRGLAFGPLAA
jgi:hypothetical protein